MGTYNVSSESLLKFLFIDYLTFLCLLTRYFNSSIVNLPYSSSVKQIEEFSTTSGSIEKIVEINVKMVK